MSETFNNILLTAKRLYKRRLIRLGLPFATIVVGGSFLLKQFTQVRFTYADKNNLTPDVAQEHGIEMKPREEVTLETVFEEVKKIDITNWENKRIPRPWEETSQ